MTKHTQGSLFKKFRDLIMGVIQIKKILKKSKEVTLGRRVCGYLVPETKKHKGTTGVCWKSDIHGGSIREVNGLASKGIS